MDEENTTPTEDGTNSTGIEHCTRSEIADVQSAKLQELVQWIYDRSPFWRNRFDDADCDPSEITEIADLARAPFGRKEAYRATQAENPPYGELLCRDEETIAREGGFIWETSGTTGEPIKFICSRSGDYETDVEATCRILRIAGVEPGDTVAMFWPLTLWAVGHGIIDAAKRLNVTVLPLGPSYSTEIRVQKIATYRPDVLMTTPSYALRLGEIANQEGIDPAALGIDRAIVSGEPLPEATREEIGTTWDVDDVYDYYGFSEAFNCRSIECSEHDGIHVLEDLYLCQVLEPDGTEPVPEGDTGELVVTALEQRDIATGFHYRTGDIVRYTDEPCDCGRTTRRIEIVARKDDMKTVRGVNVFPQAVESVVRRTDAVNNEFRLVLERDGQVDSLSVVVEPTSDDNREAIRTQLADELSKAFGGLTVGIEFVAPGELDRFDFKADRWIDER